MSIVPRVDKRIKEFIEQGYDVEVFSFGDEEKIVDINTPYKVEILVNCPRLPYIKRLLKFTPKIADKVKEYNRSEVIFYFFSLNVSIATLFLRKITYVYEESDMLFDRSKQKSLRIILKYLNKRIISKSRLTVFTSEGFGEYYYGENVPKNIIYIPNKVSSECITLPSIEKEKTNIDRLRFGFVGYVRYYTLYNFAKVLVTNFSNYEFHFYGKNNFYTEEEVNSLICLGNIYFHGQFKNPNDLPLIFSKLDFVVATYDVRGINPRYAEPNKIYESIFFRTPIIVSSNSFLANKVEKYGIGLSVDPLDEKDIVEKIGLINNEKYNSFIEALERIPKNEAVNTNEDFFKKISQI